MMKWTRKEVVVNAARVCGLSGYCWLYYKCFVEGRPLAYQDEWTPELDYVNNVMRPDPLVEKLDAFISEMKHKKKKMNDKQDDIFHPIPNNSSPLGLQLVSHTSYQQENEPMEYF